MDLIPTNELTFHRYGDAVTVAKILMENGNVVMLSMEEDLWVLNWVWTAENADRNDVVFMSRADWSEKSCDSDDEEAGG